MRPVGEEILPSIRAYDTSMPIGRGHAMSMTSSMRGSPSRSCNRVASCGQFGTIIGSHPAAVQFAVTCKLCEDA